MFLRNVTLDILQTLQQRSIQYCEYLNICKINIYLEFLLDSITAYAEEQPQLIGEVLSQMLVYGGLSTLAPRADRAIECGGVHDVVVV